MRRSGAYTGLIMTHSARLTLLIAAFTGMLAVILGAFGAHALRDLLEPRMLAAWQTAVEYQFWHVAALLAVGTMQQSSSCRWLRGSAIAFMLGMLLFSGSLYAMALSGLGQLGIITPFGGVTLILAWLFLFISLYAGRSNNAHKSG
jgi:uncharacterized membrane protein YgdD (TMEM256/DUF423 family)